MNTIQKKLNLVIVIALLFASLAQAAGPTVKFEKNDPILEKIIALEMSGHIDCEDAEEGHLCIDEDTAELRTPTHYEIYRN